MMRLEGFYCFNGGLGGICIFETVEEHALYKRSLANMMWVYRKEITFYWDSVDKMRYHLLFIFPSIHLCSLSILVYFICFQKVI